MGRQCWRPKSARRWQSSRRQAATQQLGCVPWFRWGSPAPELWQGSAIQKEPMAQGGARRVSGRWRAERWHRRVSGGAGSPPAAHLLPG